MKILKGFDQFVNEGVNDEFADSELINDESDNLGEIEDIENDIEDHVEDNMEDDMDQDEEESGQYIGNKLMNELANKLGTKVVNNSIDYEGKKINYYSETEAFHIGNNKFATVSEVLDFLNQDDSSQEEIEE